MYFGSGRDDSDKVGFLDEKTRAIFGRSFAAEPDKLVEQLKQDEAIAEADTLLLTVPNQLGVEYNVHVIESILKHVARRWAGAIKAITPRTVQTGEALHQIAYVRLRL
jgi:alkanesulfonate monooxygenase SsuD/methylene tetrahydromethanopterin reductase-like flavin-dependent oxidoreductase (luciferase family)